MKTSRVLVREPEKWAIETAPVPEPGPGEVLLELDSAGICGGDLSLLHGRNSVATYPTVLGHECAATVAAVGPGTTAVRPGDGVIIYPTLGCGACDACREGRTNNCSQVTVLGLTDPRGCFSTRFVLPEQMCIPVPPTVFERFGALIEPMAVAQHVLKRVGGVVDARVLIVGTGSIGLALALTARATGAKHITSIDVSADRAALAERAGVDTFLVSRNGTHFGLAGHPAEIGECDVALDVVCLPDTVALCQEQLVPAGTLGLVAAAKPGQHLEIDYARAYLAEQRIAASRNYTKADFEGAITLLADTDIDATLLRTAVVPVDRFDQALDALSSGRHLKVLLTRPELLGSRPLLNVPA